MDNAKKTVVALGMFDGVHIGHKKLIDTAVLIAKARGLVPAVYTFSNHPQELLGHSVNRLCSNEDRVKYMTALGIKLVDMVEFTKQIRSLPPKEFIDMLAERLNPAVIVAGYNYTFGMKKAGDTAMLEKLATARNIDAAVIPPVLANKKPVSSTRIRELIERGDVQQAQLLLGRTHNITGTAQAVPGNANRFSIKRSSSVLLPADGAYICFADTEDSFRPAAVWVEKGNIELSLLGEACDIAGKTVTVRFTRLLHPIKDNNSPSWDKDIKTAKNYFGEGY